jgi:hypothetical protein
MVTVFYGLITLMFRVNPPPMFLRVKFGKKSGGNTRVNTVISSLVASAMAKLVISLQTG